MPLLPFSQGSKPFSMSSHTPMFPPGLHDLSEAELHDQFVDGFPTSSTREGLSKGLSLYIQALKPIGVSFEIWIDGSFTTDKMDPADVDIVGASGSRVGNSSVRP
jgi:hypothetical protein